MSTERHPTSQITIDPGGSVRGDAHVDGRPDGGETVEAVEDALAVEEALEIHVEGAPYAVTMRLPGADLDLVTGFCLTEGVVERPEELATVARCTLPGGENRVLVTLTPADDADPAHAGQGSPARRAARRRQQVYVSRSSCGICGKQLIEEVHSTIAPVPCSLRLRAADLLACKAELEASQRVFRETGATHGAALFDGACQCLAFAEDVGRHNALDKTIGALARSGRLGDARLALVSSRLSFEMVQKAATVGIEVLVGLSAATTLAVRLAERQGMTLVGFLRAHRMNVYTHPERLLDAAATARGRTIVV